MRTFTNIQEAVKSEEFQYHVISNNEIHSFNDLIEAQEDEEMAQAQNIEVELIDQDDAIVKFSIEMPVCIASNDNDYYDGQGGWIKLRENAYRYPSETDVEAISDMKAIVEKYLDIKMKDMQYEEYMRDFIKKDIEAYFFFE